MSGSAGTRRVPRPSDAEARERILAFPPFTLLRIGWEIEPGRVQGSVYFRIGDGLGPTGRDKTPRMVLSRAVDEMTHLPHDTQRGGIEVLARPVPDRAAGVAPSDLTPWHFIAEGNLDYANNEDHDYGVWISGDQWWCAGCLAAPPREFVDEPGAWPTLTHAPNGLRLVICRTEHIAGRVIRRPLCPRASVVPVPAPEDDPSYTEYVAAKMNGELDPVVPVPADQETTP